MIQPPNNFVSYLSKGFLLAVVVIIPLVYVIPISDPVQSPKLFAWGFVTFAYLVFLFKNKEPWGIRTNFFRFNLLRIFLLYALMIAISLFYAINWKAGLFDLSRTILSILTLLIVTNILLIQKNGLSYLTRLVLISATILVVIGGFQFFWFAAGRSASYFYASLYEIKGLSGHKITYSIYLYLTLPFMIYGFYILPKGWKILSALLILLVLALILLIQTRAVWVGLSIMVLVSAVTLIFYRIKLGYGLIRMKIKVLVYSVIVGIIFIGLAFLFAPGFKEVAQYQVEGMQKYQLERNVPRISILKSSFRMYLDHPITGVGAGNWIIEIPPYQDDYIHYLMQDRNSDFGFQNWIRPHNDIIWILSEKGPLGLILYLAIFLALFVYLIKIVFREENKNNVLLSILILGSLAGYMGISIFSFPLERVDVQAILMILMAVVFSLNIKTFSGELNSAKINRKHLVIPGFVSLLVLFYVLFQFKSEWDLSRLMDTKSNNETASRVEKRNRDNARIISLDPFANPVKYYLGICRLNHNDAGGALDYFDKAYHEHPNNLNLLFALSNTSLKVGDIPGSISYGKKAIEVYPFYPKALLNLATAYYMNGDFERSLQALLKIPVTNPTVLKAIERTKQQLDKS
ncbi:MAG: O-antigen ligase family protein [Bacteroidales bacterium]|nr:O-antigen ligase family protein [Bacteroidales bacterium]MCF8406056.1 O-antigen ligase family protein [Bacteroidales bacterium]